MRTRTISDQVINTAPDTRARTPRMKAEAKYRPEWQEGEESQGDAAEYRREAKTEDQPATPTADAGTLQRRVKVCITGVMHPLARVMP